MDSSNSPIACWVKCPVPRVLLQCRNIADYTELITLPDGAAPVGIAAAGEYVWSTDIARGSILRVDDDPHVSDFALAPDSRPHAVIADDTGCWFTEWGTNRLGRITAEGDLAEFDLSGIGEEPHGLALDGDGVVWVAFESGVVALDRELADIGGFQSRELYRAAGADNGWLLDYRWATLLEAQNSMTKVAHTDAFANLMTLVENPETMKMSYGVPS